MNQGRTIFAQLLDFLPKYDFDTCVARYHGNFRSRKLPAYEHFLVLTSAQLTWRESLRDIETCLLSLGPKLYHSGFRQPTARSTLADANETRNWRIFADFAHVLIQQAKLLYADDPFIAELQSAAYALDSTTSAATVKLLVRKTSRWPVCPRDSRVQSRSQKSVARCPTRRCNASHCNLCHAVPPIHCNPFG